jgi:hypothetical protein
MTSLAVDTAHEGDLGVLFLDVGLVDAYCIGPDPNDTVWTAELAQRIV